MMKRMSSNLMYLMADGHQEVFGLKSWTGSCQIFLPNDIHCHNKAQMSLDYHLVDPLGDDEKDEQQSDVLDGG
jgi:hypothetical protein